jgi:hypothetical protein
MFAKGHMRKKTKKTKSGKESSRSRYVKPSVVKHGRLEPVANAWSSYT